MTNTQWIITVATGVFLITAFLFVSADTNTNTNIDTENANYKWGWNDIIGWINMHSNHTAKVTAYKMTGSASSSVGDVLFNCDTCGSANFETSNDMTGNLSGWAWNDAIGWISWCGNSSGSSTWDAGLGRWRCPVSTTYQTSIKPSGDNINSYFYGWAWSDVVGWINFNCLDTASCAVNNYKTQTSAGSRTEDATFTSTIIDIGTTTGIFNTIVWKGSQPGNTGVQFSIATSNDKNNFPAYGAWISAAAGVPVQLNIENRRYMRYQVSLKTDHWKTVSPQIDDILINYSP